MSRLAAIAAAALLLAAGSGSACSGSEGSTTISATDPTDSPATAASDPTSESSTTLASTTTSSTTVPSPTYVATIDELLALGRPIVLAHTGGEDEFPASTLFAFGESVKAGVDMLDLNINITKDDELVVQHDDTVDRNTDGTGAVRDLTYDEIARLDAAHWFSAACADCHDRPEGDYLYRGIRTGQQEPPAGYTADDFALPTLRQLVRRFPDIPLNIEIKGEGDIAKATADELAKQLKELGREQASVVASFQDDVVSYFHTIAPEVEVSPGLNVLTAYVLSSTPIPDGMRILQLPPEFSGIQVITPELVARATTDGNPIWVWPNNRDLENQPSYADFLAQGIVGLNINFPAQGVQAVQQYVDASAVPARASAGCDTETPLSAGETTEPHSAAGLDGTFVRHLPPAYDGATPLPMVLALHGWSQTAALLALESELSGAADRNGFVVVYPDITRQVPLWDPALDGADMAWITALLDTLDSTLCIDTDRVYVAGMSNGAMMTSSIGCVLSDRVAAVAAVAGVRNVQGCSPTRPVPMIAFHGTDDPYVAFQGGYGPKVAGLPSPDGTGTLGTEVDAVSGGGDDLPVTVRFSFWPGREGCDGDLVDAPFAAGVSVWQAAGCGSGRLYVIEGGGHSWPGSTFDAGLPDFVGATTMSISATDLIWGFFRQHPLTSP